MDLDRDDLNQNEDEHDEPMPAFEGAEENSSLRHRQQSFQDELARTKAKLADMPRGWESRGVSGRDWDESSEGLTPQFWVGVILLLFVIGLIIWGLFSAEDDEDTGDFYEEYDDMY